MVMAVGLHGPTPAMFHLTTHAFFKALLFLGAGSVIIALHHEQDIWKMGGLRKKMPVTFWTFLVGTLALAACRRSAAFTARTPSWRRRWHSTATPLFVLGVVVAALTTFYMFRLVFVAFLGAPKSEAAGHAHESPPVMTWPLRILAVFSVIGGFIGIEQLYATAVRAGEHAAHALVRRSSCSRRSSMRRVAALLGLLAAARRLCSPPTRSTRRRPTIRLPAKLGALARAMRNRFYFDELYEATVIRLHDCLAAVADWFDRWLIAGLARARHARHNGAGRPRAAPAADRQPADLRLPVRAGRGAGAVSGR